MKKTANIFCVLVAFMLLAACQNNGDIGKYFGTWRIDSYTLNSEAVGTVEVYGVYEVPVSNCTFSFQNSVVNVVTVLDDYMSNNSVFGSWSEDGDTFTLDFTHVDAETPQGTGQYSAPKWLGMVSDEPMVMKISNSLKDSFTLTWTDHDGNVRVYNLHKTW